MKEEIWDLYDENRQLTDEVVIRGQAKTLPMNRYHLCVECIVSDRDGNVLITKRAANKRCPFQWEFTAGSAIAGENSAQAVVREVFEETGLKIDSKDIVLIHTERTDNTFRDTFAAFVERIELDKVKLQEDETIECNKISFVDFMLENYAKGDNAPFLFLQRGRVAGIWGKVIQENRKHFGTELTQEPPAAKVTKQRVASDSLF